MTTGARSFAPWMPPPAPASTTASPTCSGGRLSDLAIEPQAGHGP